MTTFICDYKRLREVGGEYIKAMQTETDLEALEAGLKCFQLHYLGCSFVHDHEEAGAIALFNIITKAYFDAEVRIMTIPS